MMQLEELMNKHYKKLNENDFHVLKYILNHQDTCYKLGIKDTLHFFANSLMPSL